MKSFVHTIQDELGLHARPASMLAQEVKKYESKVTVKQGEKSVDAVSMLALMTMAVKAGQNVTIEIEGPDEEKAYNELQIFCKERV